MRKSTNAPVSVATLGASFRDPAGYVYKNNKGTILRQVTTSGADAYDEYMHSGLHEALVKEELIVVHKTVDDPGVLPGSRHVVLKPERIPYISYPFEWSFSQLQDAALLTLAIQKKAIQYGMSLKDANAYNVQFLRGTPIFIDTLSFEHYEEGKPWPAYRQFCQHFLAPLALMAYTDVSLLQLLRVHLDGVPLELAAKLLPRRARLRPGLAMHVVLHAKAQEAKASEHKRPTRPLSKNGLLAILDSLEHNVRRLTQRRKTTEWGDYYDNTNYTVSSADKKAKLITEMIAPLRAKTALDLGGNNGRYSRALHKLDIATVCTDIDPNAVEANYRYLKTHGETHMLPLVVDLTNPGGALGWHNTEREPVHERLKADVVLVLALIHHLAISNNLPLGRIAEYLREFGPYVVLEFVPKTDSQVQKLLSTRDDIFPGYTEDGLKQAFAQYFTLKEEVTIPGSKRTLYLFKRK